MAFKSFNKSYKILNDYIPDGYDIYVLGVQEGINDTIYKAMN